jgi:RHS repeat-associated protein
MTIRQIWMATLLPVLLTWSGSANAGTNMWTTPHAGACGTAGQPTIAAAVNCHSQWYPDFNQCSLGQVQPGYPQDWGGGLRKLRTRVKIDGSFPEDHCATGLSTWSHADWFFTIACPADAPYNEQIGGCVPSPVTQHSSPTGCLKKGNPCDILIGNKQQTEVDYLGANGVGFARSYNSLDYNPAKLTDYAQPLGVGWFGSYFQYVYAPSGLSSATVQVVRPDGGVIAFTATAPGSPATQYQPQGELKDRLVVALDGSGVFVGWRFITANDDEELYNTSGRLLTVKSRGGVTQTLAYGSNNRLASVIDDFGHALTFQWNTQWPPKLSSITLPGSGSGQIQFAYGTNHSLTQVTYPDTRTRRYFYELAGAGQKNLLTGIEDESGVRYVSWGYGGIANVVTSSAYSGGVDSYSITYNGDGSRVVVDPLGTSRTYTTAVIAGQRRYTGSNLLCQSCNEYASATFDAFGNFESKTDFGGVETRFTHDTARTLETSRTEAYGTLRARTISTTWHPSYRLPDVITEPGRTTDFDYDTNGNLLELEVTDTATSAVRRTTWTYDTYGRILTVDGPRTDVTDVTTLAYYTCTTGSQCGQLQSATNALSQVTTFDSYNAHGQPLQITDPNGVVTTLAYDLRQRLTSRTVGGEQTTIEYWPTGLVKKVTLPDSSFLLYTYDDAHRLTRIDDAAGNYVVYTLDAMGNRTAENVYDPGSALRRTRSSVFNSLNQLWKDLTAAGTAAQTTELGYDPRGNQTDVYAPLGRDTFSDYDELGRLVSMTDPAMGLTELDYDARDNLTSVTDPLNHATTYTYDGFDDLLTQTSPDTGLTTNTYDSGGNLQTSTDARGAVTTYGYDALNRVTSAEYKVGTAVDQTIAFTYDAGAYGKGRRTGASDADHSLSWVYDALGRVTSKSQTVGAVTHTVGYGYTNGNLTSLTTPSGQSVLYGYNTNGQVASITVNGATLLSSVSYEPFGPIKGWTWGNASTMSRTFDTDGKVTAIASAGDKTYGYDDAFRITGITDAITPANSYTYGFDDLDRLTSAVKTGTTRGWTYDANGNRLSETGASPSTYTISSTDNRVSAISGAVSRTYGYDAAGNTLSYSNITAAYNNRGRMSSLTKGATTATFTYNALGELVKRAGGPGTVHYVYDEAGHLLGEYDGAGALIQETIWLGDTPVATLRPGTPVEVLYVHTDHLNTPRKVTRPSDNQARWTWESDPFGTELPNENPASLGAFAYNLRFPGQIYDAHTELNYNYFRDYDPVTGRYAQSDPIGLAGGLNTYLYAGGNPLVGIDPLGLQLRLAPWAETIRVGMTPSQPTQPGFAVSVPTMVSQIQRIDPNYSYRNWGSSYNRVDYTVVAGQFARYQQLEQFQCYAPGSTEFSRIRSGATPVVNPGPTSLGANPFLGRTAREIADMLTARGYQPMGPDPVSGRGTFVNPATGRGYHIDASHPPPKGPHVGVHRPRDLRDVMPPRDYPIGGR